MSLSADAYGRELSRRRRLVWAFEWLCRLAAWGALRCWYFSSRSVTTPGAGYAGICVPHQPLRTRQGRHVGCHLGFDLAHWNLDVVFGADRDRRAIYLEEYAKPGWLTRQIQLNIANLAGVPSVVYGILGFTVFVRFFGIFDRPHELSLSWDSSRFRSGFRSARWSCRERHADIAQPADGDHRRSGSPAGRAADVAARFVCVGGDEMADDLASDVARGDAGDSHRRDSVDVAHAGRDRAAGGAGGRQLRFVRARKNSGTADLAEHPEKLLEAPFDKFTAMPLQIYTWIDDPNQDIQVHVAAAGIVVLLAFLIGMNSIAILHP